MKLLSPLHSRQEALGAQFFEYCHWQLAGSYGSIHEEMKAIRTAVGLTEYPLMSHLAIKGPDAARLLQRVCCRDVEKRCPPGRALYVFFLGDEGAVLEDGVIFHVRPDFFLLNGRPKIFIDHPQCTDLWDAKGPKSWLTREAEGLQVTLHETGLDLLSLQGPLSARMLHPHLPVSTLQPFALQECFLDGIPLLIARCGFSGELGYEFLTWPEYAQSLWEVLENLGKSSGLKPYGHALIFALGLECGFLGGKDFFPGASPLELGMDWMIDWDKPNFVGRHALLKRKKEGINARLVGLEWSDQHIAIPPQDRTLYHGDKPVGELTQCRESPTLGKIIARGWVKNPWWRAGLRLRLGSEKGNEATYLQIASSYRWYDPDRTRQLGSLNL